MTDEEINITIAEVCGWTDFFVHPEFGLTGIEPNTHELRTVVPWYVCDLNAMHEALKTLNPDQLWDVAYSLPMETMLGFMATARELAETFLLMIGKWEGPTTEESSAVQEEDK